MRSSPKSEFIKVPTKLGNIDAATLPFYSIFYDTTENPYPIGRYVRQKAGEKIRQNKIADNTSSCYSVLRRAGNIPFTVIRQLPFGKDTVDAKKNTLFFMMVFVATIISGVLAFSYWARVLDGNNLVEGRAIYLSVLFMATASLLTVISYELIVLRHLSSDWRNLDYYDFIINKRKIVLWMFLIVWLAVVAFTTAVISRRPEAFRTQITYNVVAGLVLLVCQYIYYRSTSKSIKMFSLFVSVFVVSLLVVLLYGV